MIGKNVRGGQVQGVVRAEYVVGDVYTFLIEEADGFLRERPARECRHEAVAPDQSRQPRKCGSCGKPFVEQSDQTVTLCPGCRLRPERSVPCCECGEDYPRTELIDGGHVFCAKCRVSGGNPS